MKPRLQYLFKNIYFQDYSPFSFRVKKNVMHQKNEQTAPSPFKLKIYLYVDSTSAEERNI